jgi:Putative Actinobacterial Holin-X, holin superfamily III
MGEHAMVYTESAPSADGAAGPSLGDLVTLAAEDLSKLVRCEIDLARLELKKDVRRLAVAGAMVFGIALVANLVLVLLSFGLVYGLIRAGLVPWASFLIVAGVDIVLIGIAGGIAFINFRRLDGLKRTRKSVQENLAVMNREEPAAAVPAVEAR